MIFPIVKDFSVSKFGRLNKLFIRTDRRQLFRYIFHKLQQTVDDKEGGSFLLRERKIVHM